jgi:predicted DNA binding protein
MYEATFRLAGEGAYETATHGTDTRIELWCNEHCDLLHVQGEGTDTTREHVRESVGIQDLLIEDDECVLVTSECLRTREENTIEKYVARHNCLLLPPLRYADGAKFCRILALSGSNLTSLYQDLLETFSVSVETKREIETIANEVPLLSLSDALPDFSARQREVLVTAQEHGYYEIPRATTTTEIAEVVGIERRTAEEHLRRAENKLVEAMIEYVV